MRITLHHLAGLTTMAGFNVGFVMILFFLYHQWGALGVGVGFTFLPPILICPVWEWIATGHWLTFLLVYVLGFGGFGLCRLLED